MVAATFGSDPSKHTVCVDGHVDVQPAKKEDGWSTEPYNLTDINGKNQVWGQKHSIHSLHSLYSVMMLVGEFWENALGLHCDRQEKYHP